MPSIYGTPANEVINGGGGSDTLRGYGGADLIHGDMSGGGGTAGNLEILINTTTTGAQGTPFVTRLHRVGRW